MNQVESAVTSVAVPDRASRARRAPAAPAPAARGAASESKTPGRGRGRQAIVLKGGKPYKEDLGEAKAAIKAAKQVVKAAKERLFELGKVHTADLRAVDAASKELGRIEGKPLPDRQAQKVALANAKAALKAAQAAARQSIKDVAQQQKAVDKAKVALAKAEEGKLKVEQAKLAAKTPASNAVN